jgi:hypothetical protein
MVTLREMKDAVTTYFNFLVKSSVTVTAGPLEGSQINPRETFTILLTVANAVDDLSQGVQIIDVIYHVRISDPTKAKLIVPPTSVGVARSTPSPDAPPLPPGTEVDEMFLFPSRADLPTLNVGETDSLRLTGRAHAVGIPRVFFNILGDVDLGLTDRSNLPVSAPVPIVPIVINEQ